MSKQKACVIVSAVFLGSVFACLCLVTNSIPVAKATPTAEATDLEPEAAGDPSGCPKEANLAVLDKLYPAIGASPEAEDEIAANESRIKCIRDWANTLSDPCMRVNYLDWLAYYSDRDAKNLKSLKTRGKVESDYDRERREEQQRVAKYVASHQIPAPPSCDRGVIEKVK